MIVVAKSGEIYMIRFMLSETYEDDSDNREHHYGSAL
jgi:hypothetical protein